MDSVNDNFYLNLQGFTKFSQFNQLNHYQAIPTDWVVIITDVQGSTKAIEAGKYKDVNAIGVASIVAVLNAIAPLKIPYVFGGDGATFCVPVSKEAVIKQALVATKQMALKSFGLQLRVGMVAMQKILQENQAVLVAKYQPYPNYEQAMFAGSGLGYAELLIKDPDPENPYLVIDAEITPEASFEGFECRWREIPSPHDESIAIIVQAFDGKNFTKEHIYGLVLEKIFSIYGQAKDHHPIHKENLTMGTSIKDLKTEIGVKTASLNWVKRLFYPLKAKFFAHLGQWFMARGIHTEMTDWSQYEQTMIMNTDYRKFDEVLRMILSGTVSQRQALENFLDGLYEKGQLVYGIQASPSSLITCLIFNYHADHVHFLDGSNGGYALAAKKMKEQLKKKR